MPNLSKNTEGNTVKAVGPNLTAESSVAVLIAAFFALWVYISYKGGNLAGGALLSCLLYIRFAFAIANSEPNSRNRAWAFAALPVIVTPAGIIVCIATLLLVNRLRKMPLNRSVSSSPADERKDGEPLADVRAMSWAAMIGRYKAGLIAIVVVIGLGILAVVFRYEEGGILGLVFRYDRFTKVVYMRSSSAPGGWVKTDYVNLQHAIDTIKLDYSNERHY